MQFNLALQSFHRWAQLTLLLVLMIRPAGAQQTITYSDGEVRATAIDVSFPNDAELVVATGAAEQSGVISGDGAIEKTGAGQLTLSAINTYTEGTSVNEGTLRISGSVTNPASNTTVASFAGNEGHLEILTGATLMDGGADLAFNADSIGNASVLGGMWTSTNINIGAFGLGRLTIDNTGTLTAENVLLGSFDTAVGTATLRSGTLTVSQDLTVGFGGQGFVVVSPGFAIESESTILAAFEDAVGQVIMGGGTWLNTFDAEIGLVGDGMLTLVGGVFTADCAVLAGFDGSSGILTFGNGTDVGVLDVNSICGGSDGASMIFNHAQGNYHLSTTGTSSGVPIPLEGTLAVFHNGTGTTTFAADSLFDGEIVATNGTILLENSTGSATGVAPVTLNSGATLSGSGTASSLVSLRSGGRIVTPAGGQITLGSLEWAGGGRLATTLQSPASETGLMVVQGAMTRPGSGSLRIELSGNAVSGRSYVLAQFGSTSIPLSAYSVLGASGTLRYSGNQLIFTATSPTPPESNSTPRIRVQKSKKNSQLTFIVTNPGPAAATFRLRIGAQRTGDGSVGGGGADQRRIRRIFNVDGRNVTRRISLRTGSGVDTPRLQPGQSARVTMRVRVVRPFQKRRVIESRLIAFNVSDPAKSAVKSGRLIKVP